MARENASKPKPNVNGINLAGKPKKKPVAKSVRAGITFPPTRVGNQLRSSVPTRIRIIRQDAKVCLAAVLEYITTEILDHAGEISHTRSKISNTGKKSRILPRDIRFGIEADEELAKLLNIRNVTWYGLRSIGQNDRSDVQYKQKTKDIERANVKAYHSRTGRK